MLAEPLVIVLLVSFFSLGLRTGLVVALAIPSASHDLRGLHCHGIGLHGNLTLGRCLLALEACW